MSIHLAAEMECQFITANYLLSKQVIILNFALKVNTKSCLMILLLLKDALAIVCMGMCKAVLVMCTTMLSLASVAHHCPTEVIFMDYTETP